MKDWFLHKNDAEQKIGVLLVVFSLLLLLYSFLYVPLKQDNVQLQLNIAAIEAEIAIMRGWESEMRLLSNQNLVTEVMDNTQLMTLLEESAKQQQLSVSKMLETGKNKFSVTLSEVAFNAVLRWLDLLQTQYHLTIAQLSIEAIKNGRANAVVVIHYAIQ